MTAGLSNASEVTIVVACYTLHAGHGYYGTLLASHRLGGDDVTAL